MEAITVKAERVADDETVFPQLDQPGQQSPTMKCKVTKTSVTSIRICENVTTPAVGTESKSGSGTSESQNLSNTPSPVKVSPSGTQPYCCRVCGLTFFSKFNYDAHMKSNLHSGDKPFKCNKCDSSYKTYSGFMTHRRRVHEKFQALWVVGPGNLSVTKVAKVQKPKQKAVANRDFQCDLCDKSYIKKGHLLRHRHRVHNEEKMSNEMKAKHGVSDVHCVVKP